MFVAKAAVMSGSRGYISNFCHPLHLCRTDADFTMSSVAVHALCQATSKTRDSFVNWTSG